jgi:hypothetical protein
VAKWLTPNRRSPVYSEGKARIVWEHSEPVEVEIVPGTLKSIDNIQFRDRITSREPVHDEKLKRCAMNGVATKPRAWGGPEKSQPDSHEASGSSSLPPVTQNPPQMAPDLDLPQAAGGSSSNIDATSKRKLPPNFTKIDRSAKRNREDPGSPSS